MSKYGELDSIIRSLATTPSELRWFKDLTTAHFEGKSAVWEQMPTDLQIAIAEWENEQIR